MNFAHPARIVYTQIRLVIVPAKGYSSNRYFSTSFTDEHLPLVPDRVFVHTAVRILTPCFWEGVLFVPTDEYLPQVWKGIHPLTNTRPTFLTGCSSTDEYWLLYMYSPTDEYSPRVSRISYSSRYFAERTIVPRQANTETFCNLWHDEYCCRVFLINDKCWVSSTVFDEYSRNPFLEYPVLICAIRPWTNTLFVHGRIPAHVSEWIFSPTDDVCLVF